VEEILGMFWFQKQKRSQYLENSPPTRKHLERESERINCELPIVFANHETGEIAKGSAFNYSQRGLYIELDHCPTEGTGALVHMTQYSPKGTGPDNLKKYYVEVKWVKQISEAENQDRYAIGVRHCSDIYELFRLFGD
jgi:hypothetical protein